MVSKLVNTGLLSGIEMRRREDSISLVQESDSKDIFKELIEKSHVSVAAAAEAELEAVEAEEDEDADAEDEDAEEAEEDAAEEDEEALELEEFEYKGVTYYKDTENQVYQIGEDGDLDDTAIGVWNEEKQKVLKYAKA
jgi:ribosomal protein L12E/L44/L45/RPP1/RPP2